MKYDTLICLSGGLDSTFAAWKWLTQNQGSNKRLLLHHVHLKNYEGRLSYESKAVELIIKWFRANGFDNFDYSESSFDYGTIPHIVQDIELIGFIMGVLVRAKSYSIKQITICASAHDITLPGYSVRSNRRYNVIRAITDKDCHFIYPIIKYSRQKMIEAVPKDLLALCWFCRKPNEGKACAKCRTCKSTLPYLEVQ